MSNSRLLGFSGLRTMLQYNLASLTLEPLAYTGFVLTGRRSRGSHLNERTISVDDLHA